MFPVHYIICYILQADKTSAEDHTLYRDGFGPKFSGPRPIWAGPAQPKLVGPWAGPNPNPFPYRWVWAKIFRPKADLGRPGPAQIGWALGWARPKPIPSHKNRKFFLDLERREA